MTLSERIKKDRPLALAGLFLVGMLMVLMVAAYYYGTGTGLERYSPVAEIMGALILLLTLILVYMQIGHIRDQNDQFRKQNDLQRNVASKSAIQELNEVLLDKQQEDFLRFVVPNAKDEKGARQTMMAFSLMNSLEILYLTQKDNVSRKDFKRLLSIFTTNVRGIWNKDFATVYHPDFQQIVKEVFDENSAGGFLEGP